ncbi:transmembrane protein 272-like isoform X2 [Dendrobates tinctorius]|uniref:transmembrane protein 272-like isoform X2 n=1 Tax=Dendrobates tinctorius TaxID=92724 RepID=UPI003CCA5601
MGGLVEARRSSTAGNMDGEDNPRRPLLTVLQDSFLPKSISIALKCILVGLNIASITIGVIYFNDCPGQYLIPYYLIISGAASLLHLSLTCLPRADEDQVTFASFCAQGVMLIFLFIFFIVGNVWIYSLAGESWDNPSSPKYCHRVLYLYAFWTITLSYIGLFLLLCSYLCLLLCLYILKWSIFGMRR